MPWVKLDDSWCEDEQVLKAGPLAGWLHICALSYCNRRLTDGRVPAAVVRRLADVDDALQLAAQLVDAGLWRVTDDGFELVDYLATQPSRERVEQDREAKRRRQERWLANRKKPATSRATSRDASRDASKDTAPPRPEGKRGGGLVAVSAAVHETRTADDAELEQQVRRDALRRERLDGEPLGAEARDEALQQLLVGRRPKAPRPTPAQIDERAAELLDAGWSPHHQQQLGSRTA